MKESFDTQTILILFGLITGASGCLLAFWKLFSYLSQMSSKNDTLELRQMIQDLSLQIKDVRYELSSLEKELNARTPVSKFDLLQKDIDFLRSQMVTKKDLYIMKDELLNELKHESN